MTRVPARRNQVPERYRPVDREVIGYRYEVRNVVEAYRRKGTLIAVNRVQPLRDDRVYAVLRVLESAPEPQPWPRRHRKTLIIATAVTAVLAALCWGVHLLIAAVAPLLVPAAVVLGLLGLATLVRSGGCTTTVTVTHRH